MDQPALSEHRVEFDAEVSFTNGGSLKAQGFRLDIGGDDITDAELGGLFLRHLGLLMAGRVSISNKRVIREAHEGSRGRLVELSHRIEEGMITYPGLPAPQMEEFLSREASRAHYAEGTEFSIGRITLVGNTGTYLDSPFHRFESGPDLAGLELGRLAELDGVVVRVTRSGQCAIDRSQLLPHAVLGRAVLIHTGWDRHWGSAEYGAGGHPFLTAEGAQWLVEQGALLVGIDSLNIDDTNDPRRPAHTALLGAGIPLVEHLCGLEQLPPQGFRFHAAPPRVAGFGTWPVRAYAVIG